MTKPIVKVWYPAVYVAGEKMVPGDAVAHIYYKGSLLCKLALNIAMQKAKATTSTLRDGVIRNHDMCKECQDMYKSMPEFPWRKWVEAASEHGK